jgi:two-component system, response regulator, stage 0 sporulation protein F
MESSRLESGSNAGVLIADDEPSIREFVATLLRLEGYFVTVSVAADRDEALQIALKEQPGLILMDYSMPGIEPKEFVAKIRSGAPASQIVLMTSEHCVDERAGELGLTRFIGKPFDIFALRELVKDCTGAVDNKKNIAS